MLTNLKTVLVLTLLLTVILPTQADEAPELQRILKAHVDAMGGWRAWNKIQSIRLTGTIQREGQTVDFCIIKKRPRQIRATITMPLPDKEDEEVQFIRAYDGKTAWTATRMAGGDTLARQTLTGDAASDLIDEAQVLPKLMYLCQTNTELKKTATMTYEGKVHHVIHATLKDNPEKRYEFYLADETHLVSKSIAYKDGEIVSSATLSGAEAIAEITVAKTLHLHSPSAGSTLMQIEDVTIGVGIYEEYFETVIDTATVSAATR